MIFNASRFENDLEFRCEADNIVLQASREKPLSSALTLEVLCKLNEQKEKKKKKSWGQVNFHGIISCRRLDPPVVKISPPEITVNTSDTVLLNCEYVANPASLTQVIW